MCGIAGLSLAQPNRLAREVLISMTGALRHRGPDAAGYFVGRCGRNYLGFRRLAIRDLNRRADQPMRSSSGRTWIIFNGEIYNTKELTHRFCEGVGFRTTGDTEVLLEAFERHGADVFSHCNGMFAAALYDEGTETVTLVRDRMGKKPLYLYEESGFVAFASELRSLKQFGLQIDPDRAPFFFQFGYIPSPRTFFQNTIQLNPGELICLRAGRIIARRRFHRFIDDGWGQEPEVAMDRLRHCLADAVSIRCQSDVPLGTFLSGGIDSALVAAHLASRADEQVPAFTVEFADASHNEARGAAETAKCLGMWHEVLAIDEDRLVQLAHDFVDCYEQPYADTSGLATILLCRAVRPHVTVALSGDGGDEFFAGYARYQWFQQALSAQRLPAPVRRCLRYVVPWLDQRRGDRIARLLARHDGAGLYAEILRNWTPGALSELLPEHRQAEELAESLVRDLFARLPADPLAQAACFDATYYLPDDLQVKLDRASMRVGLEVRCPLLDFRVAGLGAATATARKLRRGPKSILREVLAEHLPAPPLGRPKHGFSVPLARWLRGPLRGFAHDALNSQVFRETSWLDQALVQRLWREFQQGRQQWAHSIWMLVSVACTIRPVAVGPVHRLLKASDRRAA